MINKRKLFLIISCFVSFSLFAQGIVSIFDKYAENKSFRYVSISKGMINLSSLFGKEDPGNEQMLSRVDGVKVLTLKSSRKSTISKAFFADVEKVIVADPTFQSLMEARDKGVFTRVYNRTTKNNKTDILIISKSDTIQHFIWLKGTISTQELQKMIKK